MKKLIDTHSHIYYDKYNHDLDEVINRSLDKGVDKINEASPEKSVLKEMGLWITQGKTVALPTETVYGLGASAVCTEAVRAIFEAKNRPPDNPLIAHIADRTQLGKLGVTWTENMEKLCSVS